MKRRVISVVLVSVLSSIVLGCGILDDRVPRKKIFSYVNENYELLESFPHEEIPEDSEEEIEFIKEYLGKKTIVRSVYAYNENVVQFYCGGKGLSIGSTYTGFYYSKDDTPFALYFEGVKLSELKPGVYEWKNSDGTHRIYTERIRDNWFYYVLDWY